MPPEGSTRAGILPSHPILVRLLDFSFEQNNVPFDPETFSAFFRIPRKAQFISILRFLLLTLDQGHFSRELSQHTCPTSETALKCVISKWLRECRPAIKLPASVFSVLGYPGGVTAVEFLSALSSFVLQSKLSSVPDCLADLVSSIHGLIRSNVRDRAIFCTIDNSLSSHLVKREEQLAAAKTGLSKIVAEVKEFAENRWNPIDMASDSYLENANHVISDCQTYQRELLSEVLANRSNLEALLREFTSFKPDLLNIMHHAENYPPPTLNAERLQTRRLPEIFAVSAKETRACGPGSEMALTGGAGTDSRSTFHFSRSSSCDKARWRQTPFILVMWHPNPEKPTARNILLQPHESVKPLREEGKLNLYRFLRSADALFSVGCRILDAPSQELTVDPTTSGTTQDDAIVDWCSRVFKRAAYLCNPADSPSASSTATKSPHQPSGQSQISTAENGLEEFMLSMRSFIVSNQRTESQLTPLTSYRRQSTQPVLERQHMATTNCSFPSDQSSTDVSRNADVINSSPLRSLELSQLSGTPAATTRKISTPRHLDVRVLQSWKQDLGKLDIPEKQALKISGFEADSVQMQSNTSDEIENTDPFASGLLLPSVAERSVAAGEQVTPTSKWIPVETRTARSPVSYTEQRPPIKFSSDLSNSRQILKTLNQNSLDPGHPLKDTQRLLPVNRWIPAESSISDTDLSSFELPHLPPLSLDASHGLKPRTPVQLGRKDDVTATVGANFKKLHVDRDTELTNFNLFEMQDASTAVELTAQSLSSRFRLRNSGDVEVAAVGYAGVGTVLSDRAEVSLFDWIPVDSRICGLFGDI
ncbi:hypothetical protein T265_15311, partial [Opisthorchis viverrini]